MSITDIVNLIVVFLILVTVMLYMVQAITSHQQINLAEMLAAIARLEALIKLTPVQPIQIQPIILPATLPQTVQQDTSVKQHTYDPNPNPPPPPPTGYAPNPPPPV